VIIDDELFIRSPGGMTPTQRALEIEPVVIDCLNKARKAVFPPKEFQPQESTRKFIIGGTDFSVLTIIPKLIAFLNNEAPNLRLEMKPCLPNELLSKLDEGELDFAVRSGKSVPKRFSYEKLFEEDMVVITRKNHPFFEDKDSLTLEEYCSVQHIYITSKGEGEQVIDKYLKKQSLQRDIYIKVQNFLIAPYIVENSNLVTTVSERVAYQCSQKSQLKIFPFPVEIEKNIFHIIWSKTINADKECMWLINSIINLIRDHNIRDV